jgi:hypothetical protein
MNKIISVTAVMTISILILYGYYGGFASISFNEKKAGGETIVFKNTKGDYPQTEIATNDILSFIAKNIKTTPSRNFSYYEMNPHVMDKKNLKSQGGCILDATDTSYYSLLRKSYKIRSLENDNYVVTSFPLKGKLSVLIAQIRVYPNLYRYINAKGYNYMSPVTEIYDNKKHLIIFRMKISKNPSENS